MSTFIDTSIWYAAVDRSDVHNSRARRILADGDSLITTDHVLAETWALIYRRLSYKSAERFWDGIRNGVATLEIVGAADLERAWAFGQDYRDQDFSLTDRTSFAVMLRLGLEHVASLDAHFAIFRYGPNRRRAFTVVS